MFKRVFSVALMFFSVSYVFAQDFSVSGVITDEAENPVAYANILVLKAQDSSVVTGTTSDDKGLFILERLQPSKYILKTSFISYEETFLNFEIIDKNITLPNITLKESVEALSEVELVYRKPTLKREVDRLVFNVEKSALSEGNLMDVLRNTPSVLVLDDAITVKGSSPTIYINDKRVYISSSEIVELLQGTSASNIQSVEVITNPPARYDADSGVVLNIVMSKNLVSGYHGSIFSNVTQGVFIKTNHGMTNYFKGKNISLFANYSYNNAKINREDHETIQFPTEFWNSYIDRNRWSETHNVNLNFDWDLSERSTISLSTNTQFLPYSKRVTKSDTDISPVINTEVSRFNSQGHSSDLKNNLGFDIDFVHQFKEGSKLSLNAHYTTYDFVRRQNVESDYFLGNNSFFTNTQFRTYSDQEIEILASKIDYAVPISETANFEIGAKISNVVANSGNEHFDIFGNSETLDPYKTDRFDYDEKIYAGYISYDKTWDSWSLSAGLRVEQTNIEGVSISTNSVNTQDYLEWFPTFNLGHQISDKLNLFINYKRSLQRPDYSFLNPFKSYLNDNAYVSGNPELRPIFTDQYKIGANINNMFTIEAYYKKYNNNMFEIPIQNNVDNVFVYTPLNINYTEEIGLDLEAYFDVTQKWNTYIGNSLYKYQDYASLFNTSFTKGRWSNFTVIQNNFSFLKDNSLTAAFTLSYALKTVQGLQTSDSLIFTDLSIKKSIFKGKGVLSLTLSDLFNRQNYFVTTELFESSHPNYQKNTSYKDLDDRYIRLGFRYKFGNTKLSTNERSTSVEERERLGNKH